MVLPDFSGNRFYQSLGNVESDGVAGLLVADFTRGDLLQLTGTAENLYGADAAAVMPRVTLALRIRVTGAVLMQGGLNLEMASEEVMSPYNPPVRYLASEIKGMGLHLPPAVRSATGATDASTPSTSCGPDGVGVGVGVGVGLGGPGYPDARVMATLLKVQRVGKTASAFRMFRLFRTFRIFHLCCAPCIVVWHQQATLCRPKSPVGVAVVLKWHLGPF